MSYLSNIRPHAVSRRLLFRKLAAIAGGAVIISTSAVVPRAAAVPSKDAQKTAGYQPTPRGTARCDGCTEFESPSSCKTVEGTIAPAGWCRLYIKKPV